MPMLLLCRGGHGGGGAWDGTAWSTGAGCLYGVIRHSGCECKGRVCGGETGVRAAGRLGGCLVRVRGMRLKRSELDGERRMWTTEKVIREALLMQERVKDRNVVAGEETWHAAETVGQ